MNSIAGFGQRVAPKPHWNRSDQVENEQLHLPGNIYRLFLFENIWLQQFRTRTKILKPTPRTAASNSILHSKSILRWLSSLSWLFPSSLLLHHRLMRKYSSLIMLIYSVYWCIPSIYAAYRCFRYWLNFQMFRCQLFFSFWNFSKKWFVWNAARFYWDFWKKRKKEKKCWTHFATRNWIFAVEPTRETGNHPRFLGILSDACILLFMVK